MINILAKDNGTTLYDHSCCVEIVAEYMTKIICNDKFIKKHLDSIKLSARLHDLGKCIQRNQDFFKGIKKTPVILHHEVSWAILSTINDIKSMNINYILYSIYWHHLKPKYDKITNDSSFDIIKHLSGDDLDRIYDFYVFIHNTKITRNEFIKRISIVRDNSKKYPDFYSTNNIDNQINTIYRNIIVGSDQLVSSEDVDLKRILALDSDYINEIIRKDKMLVKCNFQYFTDDNTGELNSRFKQQLDIVDDVINSKTNSAIVKAPAGFGKTLLGVLWSLKSKRKLLWICPRNIIVDSVYKSITDELYKLGVLGEISVEVFLTGERKMCTNTELPEYGSDIVITNIDNYLNVITKKRHAYKCYDILYRDIIFDEYHEFISDQLMFGMFVLMMNIRHRILNTKTLLLSATPSIMEYLWCDDNNETLILPSKNKHFNAVHNHKYKVNLISDTDVVTVNDSIIITNTIKNSQQLKKQQGCDILLHSDFMDADKKNNFNDLMFEYGKSNLILSGKKRVVSAPIVQASMDVSFQNLSEYVLSPETTVQRIGRCDRWGRFGDNNIISNINLVVRVNDNTTARSNDMAVQMLYQKDLNLKWLEYLKNNVNEYMSLEDFYIIYNDFNARYYDDIKNFIEDKNDNSKKLMCKIVPFRYIDNDFLTNDDVVSNAINFRTSTDQRFIIYNIKNTNDYTTPFTEEYVLNPHIVYKEDKFNAKTNVDKNIKKYLIGNVNFKYKKRVTYDIHKLYHIYAKCKLTPYMALNKEYSKEYGLMEK